MLNECLGLYNKPKAEVLPGHKLTGPKEEEEEYNGKKVLNGSLVGIWKNNGVACGKIFALRDIGTVQGNSGCPITGRRSHCARLE